VSWSRQTALQRPISIAGSGGAYETVFRNGDRLQQVIELGAKGALEATAMTMSIGATDATGARFVLLAGQEVDSLDVVAIFHTAADAQGALRTYRWRYAVLLVVQLAGRLH
jgi:hypothetical protein